MTLQYITNTSHYITVHYNTVHYNSNMDNTMITIECPHEAYYLSQTLIRPIEFDPSTCIANSRIDPHTPRANILIGGVGKGVGGEDYNLSFQFS